MHYLNPDKYTAHVVLLYKNFLGKDNGRHCHIGLGVNALHTVKVLRQHRIRADAYGVWTLKDITDRLAGIPSCTHAVVEAPWLTADQTHQLLTTFPTVHFVVRNHSQVAFLIADNRAARIIRDDLSLQDGNLNFSVAANSRRFAAFCETAYQGACLYLPNLYWFDRPESGLRHWEPHRHRLLRVSSFGALRILKNHATAAAAALELARHRGCDLEFYISVNRDESGKGVCSKRCSLGSAGPPW